MPFFIDLRGLALTPLPPRFTLFALCSLPCCEHCTHTFVLVLLWCLSCLVVDEPVHSQTLFYKSAASCLIVTRLVIPLFQHLSSFYCYLSRNMRLASCNTAFCLFRSVGPGRNATVPQGIEIPGHPRRTCCVDLICVDFHLLFLFRLLLLLPYKVFFFIAVLLFAVLGVIALPDTALVSACLLIIVLCIPISSPFLSFSVSRACPVPCLVLEIDPWPSLPVCYHSL